MNYITPTEWSLYYDSRRLYEMASDSGVPLTAGGFGGSTIVAAMIRQASATIDSALQTGQRYDRSQLEDIVNASNAMSATDAEKSRAEPIKSLTAHLAFGMLMSRRGYSAQKMQELAPLYTDALNILNLLSSGQRILDIDGPKAAGVPTGVRLGSQLTSWTKLSPMFGFFPTSPNDFMFPTYGG